MVGLWADAELSSATKGIAGTVAVALTGLDADAGQWVGGVGYRVRWATAFERPGQILARDAKATSADSSTLIDVNTADQGIAGVARLALADMASRQVCANGIFSTSARRTALIDIDASSGNILRVVGPPIFTHTIGVLLLCLAIGMLATGDPLAGLRAAHRGRASHKRGRAGAGVGAKGVLTDCVRPTNARTGATLVNIQAEGASSREARSTQAFSVLTDGIVGAVKV